MTLIAYDDISVLWEGSSRENLEYIFLPFPSYVVPGLDR